MRPSGTRRTCAVGFRGAKALGYYHGALRAPKQHRVLATGLGSWVPPGPEAKTCNTYEVLFR